MIQEYLEFAKNHPELFSNDEAMLKLELNSNIIANWMKLRRKELAEKRSPIEWAEIGIILRAKYILVIRDLVEFPDGNRGS